jgi:hypothetical protein
MGKDITGIKQEKQSPSLWIHAAKTQNKILEKNIT